MRLKDFCEVVKNYFNGKRWLIVAVESNLTYDKARNDFYQQATIIGTSRSIKGLIRFVKNEFGFKPKFSYIGMEIQPKELENRTLDGQTLNIKDESLASRNFSKLLVEFGREADEVSSDSPKMRLYLNK